MFIPHQNIIWLLLPFFFFFVCVCVLLCCTLNFCRRVHSPGVRNDNSFSEKKLWLRVFFFLLLFCWAEPGAIREECVLIVFSSLFLCLCLFSLSLLLLHPLINYTHLLVHALRVIIVRCDVCVCVCPNLSVFLIYLFFFFVVSTFVPFRSSFRSPRRV